MQIMWSLVQEPDFRMRQVSHTAESVSRTTSRTSGLTDMYSSAFYPFKTEEERWAYWARHILMNRYDMPATELYRLLFNVIKDKNYFVITTNVDGQFEKSGFECERIFAVQGDYAYLQCANGCHDKLYYNEDLVREMARQTKDCRIPSELVPRCPVCGGKMDVHVRKDRYFVQDNQWYASYERYQDYMEKTCDGKNASAGTRRRFQYSDHHPFPF